MDGTFHALEEHLDDHPNGRCAMVPVLKGEEGAGPGWETGAEWLARQGPEVQEKVLGRAEGGGVPGGAVQIEEYVGQRRSREWGARGMHGACGRFSGKRRRLDGGRSRGGKGYRMRSLIPALVRSQVEPSPRLLERVQGYVAGRGFDPQRLQRVDEQVAGYEWQGRLLCENDLLPTLEQHYLKHVIARGEWTEGTTIAEYAQVGEVVASSDKSGVLASYASAAGDVYTS